ncbi:LptM family lipoprotein [Oceanobacillus neutriphilus]|uniref:Lipoprotein n=1 Tax=Oceanobacillus neutriphilus TaxID=531815 RepID=A0ABQ2NUL4_9BACI|nr:hypothetical protein [Oceanobacillus neutriphilus]GGP10923.1 hypothetical protein GCM10011346_20970 [Oceanobacillus neutriphilus]
MKRVLMVLITGLTILTLAACGQNEADANTISISELTEREDAILSITSEQSFVFDFNIDDEYKEAAVWIEKYEAGNLIDDKLGYMTTQAEQKGSIIFTLSENDSENNNSFNVGIAVDGGVSSIHGSDSNVTDLENVSIVSGSIPEKIAVDNGEVVLASISYSQDENGIQSLTTDFYEDAAGHMNELEEYEFTYLLKAEFIK